MRNTKTKNFAILQEANYSHFISYIGWREHGETNKTCQVQDGHIVGTASPTKSVP